MSGRFVRASKFRHVFGRSTKKDQCYDNLRISKNAWDTNLVKANPQYISVNWEAGGGGAFAVIPLDERGKLPERIPLFRGHTAAVLDTDWSPFDDSFIASGSDDGKVFLWKVPENFNIRQDPENVKDISPVAKLTGHSRKVGHVLFNPSAQNILASSSGDYSIKIWDVDAGASKLSLKHGDIVQSLSWSANGSLLTTTCRDKKLRVWDVRQQKPAVETPGHNGAKNSRAVWMGDHDRIATTGFSKMSDRQLGLWDVRAAREPLNGFEILDQISGVCMPFWDEGTQCLFLAGKGDGNIRYYEYENDKFEYLSQHSSPDPQRGVAFLPKRGVKTHDNEIARAYKTVNDAYIEPISFVVPRRAEVFQGDIYPPTPGTKPGLSSSEWLSGGDGLPPKISLESLYEGNEAEEVPGDYKQPPPQPMKAPEPTAKAPPPAEEPFEPAAKAPPPTMKQTEATMSAVAAKYNEHPSSSDDEDEDAETSSFEEVSRPAERASATSASAAAAAGGVTAPNTAAPAPSSATTQKGPTVIDASLPRSPSTTGPPPSATTIGGMAAVSPAITKASTSGASPSSPSEATHPSSTAAPAAGVSHGRTPSATAASASEGLRGHLSDIKALVERQTKVILQQGERLDALTREVAELRKGAVKSENEEG